MTTKHPEHLKHYPKARDLAKKLENTNYLYQFKFLVYYSIKTLKRGEKDLEAGRKKLGVFLITLYSLLASAAKLMKSVCKTCLPFMDEK